MTAPRRVQPRSDSAKPGTAGSVVHRRRDVPQCSGAYPASPDVSLKHRGAELDAVASKMSRYPGSRYAVENVARNVLWK
jgi:hypothetical protein